MWWIDFVYYSCIFFSPIWSFYRSLFFMHVKKSPPTKKNLIVFYFPTTLMQWIYLLKVWKESKTFFVPSAFSLKGPPCNVLRTPRKNATSEFPDVIFSLNNQFLWSFWQTFVPLCPDMSGNSENSILKAPSILSSFHFLRNPFIFFVSKR